MDILTALFIVAGLALVVLTVMFVLGSGRVHARADKSAYYQQILRNIDIQAEFDREHRTW